MMTINFTNEPNFDEIAKAGITMICDENMNLQISEEDYKRLENEFEAAYMDSFIVKDDVNKSIGQRIQELHKEAGMTYRYKVQDRGTGNVIGFFYTEDEANACVVLFENNDKEHGTYAHGFYEVMPLEVEEETRYRLGALVKHLRFMQGLTQTQLAEKCGMVQPNIARIEAGTYATSIDVLSRIAEALDKRIELV